MKKLIIAAFAVALFGCAQVTKWEPTMNAMPHKNAENEAKDLAECKVLALKASGWLEEGAEGTLVSAAGAAGIGALAGALIPGAVSAGTGAVIGAPIGAVAGLYWAEYEADLVYKRSYSNCLFQRGHFPIN